MKRFTPRVVGATVATGLLVSTLSLTHGPAAQADAGTPPAPFLEPYYTQGDVTGDSQVTQADVDLVAAALGTTSSKPGWAAVSAADLDGNGTIDVSDLAAVSQRVLFDDGTFDLVEASAVDMQKAMNAGVVTSVQLTQDYLDRISAYNATVLDTSATGRALNAIISTGGEALAAAAASDAARAATGGPSSMLDGIPILLKDNYDTRDMPTSAGCSCWAANQTSDDAFMVKGLRADGAIILGKASMDEFAYGFVSQYSTGSAVGSSKLVASPYNTAQSAGGSSGGTGAAISSNLGGIGFGTDTGGSIRVPSSYNQLVGLRPTVGLTSRDGIVPLALSQDTGGPIGRSVEDVAIALDAVVGTDPNDAATAHADDAGNIPTSYTADLDPDALAGKHFAYLTSMVPPATATNASQLAGRRIFLAAVQDLVDAGATVDAIDPATLAADPDTGVTTAKILGEGSGSTNEFKHDLSVYVTHHLDPEVVPRTLSDIVASGQYVPAYKSVYTSRDLITQSTYDAWIGTPDAPGTHAALIKNGKAYMTKLMDDRGLDAMIYPTALPYGTYSSNLRLSPNTGLPAITVPAGQTTASEPLPGANVNLEILGRDYSEGDLIGDAYSYEQATHHRTTPALYGALPNDVVTGPGTDADAPGDGTATVTTSASSVQAGDTFTVTVDEAAADLYAYEVGFDYDPSTVQFVSAVTGTPGAPGAGASSEGDGSLTLTHTNLGSSPGAEGDTELATVTFKALAAGPSALAVTSLKSIDSEGTLTRAPGVGVPEVTVTAAPDQRTTTAATLKPATVKDGATTTLGVTVSAPEGTPSGRLTVKVAGKELLRHPLLVDGKATLLLTADRRAGGPAVVQQWVRVEFPAKAGFKASATGLHLAVRRG